MLMLIAFPRTSSHARASCGVGSGAGRRRVEEPAPGTCCRFHLLYPTGERRGTKKLARTFRGPPREGEDAGWGLSAVVTTESAAALVGAHTWHYGVVSTSYISTANEEARKKIRDGIGGRESGRSRRRRGGIGWRGEGGRTQWCANRVRHGGKPRVSIEGTCGQRGCRCVSSGSGCAANAMRMVAAAAAAAY